MDFNEIFNNNQEHGILSLPTNLFYDDKMTENGFGSKITNPEINLCINAQGVTLKPTTSTITLHSNLTSNDQQQSEKLTPHTPRNVEIVHYNHASTSSALQSSQIIASNKQKCHACGYEIRERFMLQVENNFWHERCLRCSCCNGELAITSSSICYMRDEQIYCKQDHQRLFAAKCGKCAEPLKPTDLVFRCGALRFHTHCFLCAHCSQQLKPGDRYVLLEGRPICHRDYSLSFLCAGILPPAQWITGHPTGEAIGSGIQLPTALFEFDRLRNQPLFHAHNHHQHNIGHHGNSKRIPKRPRTILNVHQRKAFKYAFEHGSKPSRKLREQLAKDTGLSVRVVQVWFQNQRAKIKKEQRKRDTDKPSSSASQTLSIDSDGKSAIDDELKSPTNSVKSGSESEYFDDLDEEVISGRSSVSQPSISSATVGTADEKEFSQSNQLNEKTSDAIDKLYRMHQTYFAFA